MKTETIKTIAIYILIIAVLLTLTTCFYQYSLLSKQIEEKNICIKMFIESNRRWIDVHRGKVTITEDAINNIEILLNNLENPK